MGKPIIEYTIKHAIDSGVFDEIHISTDSEEIANYGKKFDLVPNFLRKKNISCDNSSLNDVIKFVLEKFNNQKKKFENICLLWATSPLRKTGRYNRFIKIIKFWKNECDSSCVRL